jgi:ABC-type lipoprotein export system ATPase subunit
MTLTVVVGSSGSGKTTFLNDVHKSHKCTYIRQYHNIRPYVTVSKIPNFDPTNLPYWDIYVREGKDSAIMVGGTMAGEFTAGLSGGQRKLLLFELVFQRTQSQSDLLIVLDEPFAGVTDDFIPFIVDRLNKMREKHNILLVTNDHVETLKKMADNDITVSAIDRSTVRVNKRENVDREKAILALSFGDNFHYEASSAAFEKRELKVFTKVWALTYFDKYQTQ